MDYKKELENIQKSLDAKKVEQIQFTERLKNLQEDREKLLVELKEFGIEEVDLAEYIATEESDIEIAIGQLKKELGI